MPLGSNGTMENKIEDSAFGISAVALSHIGAGHGKIGLQDSNLVFVTKGKEFALLVCSDGHSTVPHAREGADGICYVLADALQNLEDQGAFEADVLRYFRGRCGKRDLLHRWLAFIRRLEEGREGSPLLGAPDRELARAYGSTLKAFILTKGFLICLGVGDGALVGVGTDGTLSLLLGDDEESVSTGRTFSLCHLNPEYMNAYVFPRERFRYLFCLTDGFTKYLPLQGQDGVPGQIVGIYEEGGWEYVRESIEDFMQGETVAGIHDDVSLLFAVVEEGGTPWTKEDRKRILPLLQCTDGLFYSDYLVAFSDVGQKRVGAFTFLSDENLFQIAQILVEEIEEWEGKGRPIPYPFDEALHFKPEAGKLSLSFQGMDFESLGEGAWEFLYGLHPELAFPSSSSGQAFLQEGSPKSRNLAFLSGVLFKLFERERLYPFRLAKEWRERKPLRFDRKKALFFDEETLDYFERFYGGSFGEEDLWTTKKWREKLVDYREVRQGKRRGEAYS